MTAVLVVAGAMVGAPLRYLADRAVRSRYYGAFPWGTLLVNVAGCLVLGGLTGAGTALPAPLVTLLGTGFCGALTTYSTFSFETLRLVEEKAYAYAVVNVVVSVAAGLGGAYGGYAVAQALTA
ncbi:putative fluoride ion transporter CrcB 2 [Amycolatopsis deserti]|uniref:Fluoride-specific ion channel FluC n=1 Tax=Amycolatopsis deserti TaxID=185696 RepID=A0ABQ3J9L1_9PSEU|nr:fluoride efflux transporter CrcB [Amycolatopsis deserti]GHF13109.1 putative fluoride ion transporter CrcB 2 [Amycolatopsis deserti]